MEAIKSFNVMESFGLRELSPDELMDVNGGLFDAVICFCFCFCFTYNAPSGGSSSGGSSSSSGSSNIGVISNPDVGKAL